jgi:hypothetical protein
MSVIVVNKYSHTPSEYDFYIGRGSPLGNPYSHMDNTKALYKVDTREESIEKYENWLRHAMSNVPGVQRAMDLLTIAAMDKNINLVCFCKPKACHGDVIKKIIEERIEAVHNLT